MAQSFLIGVVAVIIGFIFGFMMANYETQREQCSHHYVGKTVEWYRCIERLQGNDDMSAILQDTPGNL